MDQIILLHLMEAAAELGALKALVQCGALKPYMKKSDAFRLYGRKQVEYWIANKLVTPRKDGDHSAAWRIDRIEIAVLAKASDTLRYL